MYIVHIPTYSPQVDIPFHMVYEMQSITKRVHIKIQLTQLKQYLKLILGEIKMAKTNKKKEEKKKKKKSRMPCNMDIYMYNHNLNFQEIVGLVLN